MFLSHQSDETLHVFLLLPVVLQNVSNELLSILHESSLKGNKPSKIILPFYA